jgi:hypothetical protein
VKLLTRIDKVTRENVGVAGFTTCPAGDFKTTRLGTALLPELRGEILESGFNVEIAGRRPKAQERS